MRKRLRAVMRWLVPGIGLKRWLLVILVGVVAVAGGLALLMLSALTQATVVSPSVLPLAVLLIAFGVALGMFGTRHMIRFFLAPYRQARSGPVADVAYSHSRRRKGPKCVAIGGGTGLPASLRALKPYTANITAIVTVADDGGSSGRLRRDMGVPPPGDLRNNIVALADDVSLMAQLFQYRFQDGDLEGHAFGNLFIAALSGVAGGLENALGEIGRVLNIQGQVLPSTLDEVDLVASVIQPGKARALRVQGESQITALRGRIEDFGIVPPDVAAFPESVAAIDEAELIVIGPGSLYTSILPNLLVPGITAALRRSSAYKIYVCNVATQPGETEGFDVADHVSALEQYIGRGVFQAVIANNATPVVNAGVNTRYVQTVPPSHEVAQRYQVVYTDLTDPERPWRHDPHKLAQAVMGIRDLERTGGRVAVSRLAVPSFSE